MDLCRNFINIFNKCHNFVDTLPTEEKTTEKIRTVPNILKRKNLKKMDTSRIIPPTFTEKNIKRKKQIFDPLRSELLTWDNLYILPVNLTNANNNLNKNSSDELKSNNSEYSPMWCPTNVQNYLDGDHIQIIETITVCTPISRITNSIYEEFIEQEYYEFQSEMNIPNFDTKSSDIETIIELSRFELNVNNNKINNFTPEDPFNEIVIKNSWKKYECLSCEKTYRSQYGLNLHLKTQHNRITRNSSVPVIALTCPRCFKTFKTCSGYDHHIIRYHNTIHHREE